MGDRSVARRVLAVAAVTGAAVLGGAPPALAAEVNAAPAQPNNHFYVAAPGETNNLRITADANTLLFDDDVMVTDNSPFCLQEGQNVRCNRRDSSGDLQIFNLRITLGDRDDSTTMVGVDLFTRQEGGAGNDTLRGSSVGHQLLGEEGDDSLVGGPPNPGGASARFGEGSRMTGGPGADRFESNNVRDVVGYDDRTAPLSLTLDGIANDGEAGEGDNILPGIDGVLGGRGDDRIIGGPGEESLFGDRGNDLVEGLGGDDQVEGGGGDDVVRGGDGSDDLLEASGRDELSGGRGIDSVLLFDDFDPVTFDRIVRDQSVTLDDAANDGGPGEGDNVGADIEDVSTGSGNDTLLGNGAINFLSGAAGNDTITGGGGSDSLSGEEGDDTLNARDGFADRVDCGRGVDRAVVDQFDDVAGCETVDTANVANAQGAPDDAPPTVSFTAPAQDAKIGGTSNVTATASDDRGIAAVVLIDDGRVVGQDTTAPYSIPYTPTGDDVGRNTLVLTAIDTAQQTATAVRPVRVDRFTPTGLTARIAPKRDARIPYRFTTSGTLALPNNVTRAQGCSGQVAIQIKAGRKTISNRRAKLTNTCTYRSAVRFTVRDRVRRGTLNVTVRYLGNDVLLPLRGKRQSVKVG